MTQVEHTALLHTISLLIAKQRVESNLFRASIINYLQHEADKDFNLLITKE